MFMIGMIVCTSMASTPLMEKKQILVIGSGSVTEAVYSVIENVHPVVFVVEAESTFSNFNVQPLLIKSYEPFNSLSIINDVGWQSFECISQNHIYKEKANTPVLIDKRKQLRKLGIHQVRDNC